MFSIDFAALYYIVTFNNNSTSSSLHMNDSGLFPSFFLAFLPDFDMFLTVWTGARKLKHRIPAAAKCRSACSITNIYKVILGTRVNPDTCGRVNSIWIRCDHITCGRGYFRIRKEKVADSKISGDAWTGPKSTYEWLRVTTSEFCYYDVITQSNSHHFIKYLLERRLLTEYFRRLTAETATISVHNCLLLPR